MSNATDDTTATPQTVHGIPCAVVTVSSTRTLEDDEGGKTAAEMLEAAGHRIALRQVIADDPQVLRDFLRNLRERTDVDAVMVTGGTGLNPSDQTVETLISLFDKRMPGYGELFRSLSYHDIGPAAMLTRATAGLMGRTVVFSMPGSPAGVRRALEKLILPQLSRIVTAARQ